MAEHNHHPATDTPAAGTMDITDKLATWNAFWNGAKWSVVGLILIAAMLAIFRTHNGY
jgi:hypothetical protein